MSNHWGWKVDEYGTLNTQPTEGVEHDQVPKHRSSGIHDPRGDQTTMRQVPSIPWINPAPWHLTRKIESNVECYYCKKKGHKRPDCPSLSEESRAYYAAREEYSKMRRSLARAEEPFRYKKTSKCVTAVPNDDSYNVREAIGGESMHLKCATGAYLRVEINGRQTWALLDTGGEITVIPSTLVLPEQVYPTKQQLLAADGLPVNVQGSAVVQVFIGGVPTVVRGLVVKGVVFLLGMDWMQQNITAMDFKKQTVTFAGRKIPYQHPPRADRGLDEAVTVERSSEVKTECCQTTEDDPFNEIEKLFLSAVFEVKPNYNDEHFESQGDGEDEMMMQPEPDPQPIIPVAVLEADDLFDWPLAHDLVHEVKEPNEIPMESIPNEQLDVILPNEIQPESQSQLPEMTIPNDEPERETETKWEEAGSNRLSEVLMHGNDDWMCTQPVSDTERSNEDDVKTNNVPNISEQPIHEISPEQRIQVEPEVREPIESNTRAIFGADGSVESDG